MPDWFWIQQVVFPVLGMGMGALFLIGLYKTVNRSLDRRHERSLAEARGGSGAEIRELTRRLELLEELAYRVQELEERLDFAERLLTQRPSVPGGPD